MDADPGSAGPDERMDVRLRTAGERWRAATDALTEPATQPAFRPDVVAVGTARRRRPGARLTLSAAAVLVIGAGVAVALAASHTTGPKDAGATGGGTRGTRPVTQPASLVGTWTLDGIEHTTANGSSGSGSSDDSNDTVTFDGSGHVTITHRCYVNKADAAIGAGTLDVTHVQLSSAIPCPATSDQAGEQQRDGKIDGVLSGSSRWTVADGQLSITRHDTTIDLTRHGGLPSGEDTDPTRLYGKTFSAWTVEVGSDGLEPPPYTLTFDAGGTSARVTGPRGAHVDLPVVITDGVIDFGGSAPASDSTCRAERAFVGLLHGRQPWFLDSGILFLGDQQRTHAALTPDAVSNGPGTC